MFASSGLLPTGVAVLNNSSTCWFLPHGSEVDRITDCHQQLPRRLLGMSCPSPFCLGLVLNNFTCEEVSWRKTLPKRWHDSKLRSTVWCKHLACTSSLLALNIRCKAGTMSQLVWQVQWEQWVCPQFFVLVKHNEVMNISVNIPSDDIYWTAYTISQLRKYIITKFTLEM